MPTIRFDPIRSDLLFPIRFHHQIESDFPIWKVKSNRSVGIGWNAVNKKYSQGLPEQWPLLPYNTSTDRDPLEWRKSSQCTKMIRDTFARVQVLSASLVRVIVFVTIRGPDLSSN